MNMRVKYLVIAITIFIIEILIATKLTQFRHIRGSVGDFLVVALIYFSLLAIRPFQPLRLAIGVFLFACLIEIGQYFHLADMLHFKRGGLPYILMGNTFSLMDIVMYFFGACASYCVDCWFLRRR